MAASHAERLCSTPTASISVLLRLEGPGRSSTSYCEVWSSRSPHAAVAPDADDAVKLVGLALRAQFCSFLKHDLDFVHPDKNGVKVVQMAINQLSYTAVKLADRNAAQAAPAVTAGMVAVDTKTEKKSRKAHRLIAWPLQWPNLCVPWSTTCRPNSRPPSRTKTTLRPNWTSPEREKMQRRRKPRKR